MKLIKTLVVLAVAAGFASVSFAAETTAPAAPAAEATKTVAAKPLVKKHHHKAKLVKKTAAKTETAPVATPAAK